VQMFEKEKPPAAVVAELEKMASTATQSLADALDTLERRDIPHANAIIDTVHRLVEQRAHVLSEVVTRRGRIAVGLAYILESIERTALYASDLCELAINHAVESPEAAPSPSAPAPVERPGRRASPAATSP
ncbi:MAG: hypothetical protein ACREB9_07330, partial [Thermoplasmata archaeon]